MNILKNFLCEEEAATAIEYAVMLALIILTCLAAIGSFGGQVNVMFNNIDSEMDNAF